jgi:hypothetical protein
MEQARRWRDLLIEAARIFLFVVGSGFVIALVLGAALFGLVSLFLSGSD